MSHRENVSIYTQKKSSGQSSGCPCGCDAVVSSSQNPGPPSYPKSSAFIDVSSGHKCSSEKNDFLGCSQKVKSPWSKSAHQLPRPCQVPPLDQHGWSMLRKEPPTQDSPGLIS